MIPLMVSHEFQAVQVRMVFTTKVNGKVIIVGADSQAEAPEPPPNPAELADLKEME